MNNMYGQNGFTNMTQSYGTNIGYNYNQQQMYPVQQKGITSVAVIANGEAGANDYPVAAGNTAVLIDFNVGKFWLKTTDVYGRPLPLEDYSFYKNAVSQTPVPEQNQNEYVRKEDFDNLTTMFAKLCQELGVDKNVQSK